MGIHAVLYDAFGKLRSEYGVGPGYCYAINLRFSSQQQQSNHAIRIFMPCGTPEVWTKPDDILVLVQPLDVEDFGTSSPLDE